MATETIYLRVDPKLHKKVVQAATRNDMSLNAYVVWALEQHLELAESAS
jgi:predicted HicB family RNase H-like nuclease